ncbi:MAG: S1 RNA-binding domain-containing protein, partial [Hyphomicrobium sp.]
MTAEASKDYSPSRDEFAALLAESLAKDDLFEGSVVKGRVVGIEKDLAVIDVGLKMEGRVPVKEFGLAGQPSTIKVGDIVE